MSPLSLSLEPGVEIIHKSQSHLIHQPRIMYVSAELKEAGPCLQRGPVPGPANLGRESLHCAGWSSGGRLLSLALLTFGKEDHSFGGEGLCVVGCRVGSYSLEVRITTKPQVVTIKNAWRGGKCWLGLPNPEVWSPRQLHRTSEPATQEP